MRTFLLASVLVAFTACTGGESPAPETPPADPAAAGTEAPAAPAIDPAAAPAAVEAPPAAPAGKVFFIEPKMGATVKSPVKFKFGAEGYTVEPAGEVKEGSGHHHLIINGAPTPKGEVVPADSTHIHYGKGETETEVPMPAGTYTLTLQFAKGDHSSYGDTASETITVTVE